MNKNLPPVYGLVSFAVQVVQQQPPLCGARPLPEMFFIEPQSKTPEMQLWESLPGVLVVS